MTKTVADTKSGGHIGDTRLDGVPSASPGDNVMAEPEGRPAVAAPKRALMKLGCQSGPTSEQRLQFFADGGSQAGLAMAWHLARQHLRFVVLEASPSLGHSWRSRWDCSRSRAWSSSGWSTCWPWR